MMKMRCLKSKIATVLICSLLLSSSSYAGMFFKVIDKTFYVDDNGKMATGWRWIDTNNDNIAECYRFNSDGSLATKSVVNGKHVNDDGKWEVDGIVQRIFKTTGKPLYTHNAALGEKDTNEYFDLGTLSSTRRINATKKENLQDLIISDLMKDEEEYRKSLVGPKDIFERPEDGLLYSRNAKNNIKKVPIATISTWHIIDDILKEDEVKVITSTQSIVAGRDMRRFVSSSNKYTAKADGVKVYGGYVWDDVIVLQGNGAYVKFLTTDNSKNYKANYFTVEVAHQTHGDATADTYCGLELYLNGNSVEVYDDFCDGEPEIISEYLDDGEKNIELRAIVTGDAPGRKIYIRNARFRQITSFVNIEDPEMRKEMRELAKEEKAALAAEKKKLREEKKARKAAEKAAKKNQNK